MEQRPRRIGTEPDVSQHEPNMRKTTATIFGALVLLTMLLPATRAARGDLSVGLAFQPQETTGSAPIFIPGNAGAVPLALEVKDARELPDATIVGDGTDDDDSPFAIRATTSVEAFARDVLLADLAKWGVRTSDDAKLVLAVSLVQFAVTERNQAVGSMYTANVRLRGRLMERGGRTRWTGGMGGEVRRYGRKQSTDNCNEVLSDALQEVYSGLLSQPRLHAAWLEEPGESGENEDRAQSPVPEGLSPAALLQQVIELQDSGLSTDLLVSFVRQQVVTTSFSAEDVLEWNKAGVPQAVLEAALERVGGRGRAAKDE